MIAASLILTLLGCGGGAEPAPAASPEGRLCGRAYGSMLDSLEDVYTQAGKDLPSAIPKADYVEACVALGLDEAQLRCLDPKLNAADPEGCKTALDPVKDKVKRLNDGLLVKPEKKEGDP